MKTVITLYRKIEKMKTYFFYFTSELVVIYNDGENICEKKKRTVYEQRKESIYSRTNCTRKKE